MCLLSLLFGGKPKKKKKRKDDGDWIDEFEEYEICMYEEEEDED
jgi:hypothetical protein